MAELPAPEILSAADHPLSPAQKPAWDTLEGKVSAILAVLGVIIAALGSLKEQGLLGDGKVAAIVGTIIAVGTSISLLAARTLLKLKANDSTAKAAALIEAAKVNPQ